MLIGLAPIFVRLSEVGPVSSAFWRVMLAWPLLLVASKLAHRTPSPTLDRKARIGLAAAGAFFAADLALWHYAIGYTSVANATLLANAAPIFVAAASWAFLREHLSSGFLLGLGVAMTGAAILVGEGATPGAASGSLRGDGLAVVAAMFYAGYLMGVAGLRRQLPTLTVMAWSSAAAAACLLPVAVFLGERLLPSSAGGWAVLVGLAVLVHVGGQGLIAYALAELPASFSSVGLLIQPVAAAVFAWVLLTEKFGVMQAVGGAIVLLGIILCRRAADRGTL
ncbi:MAG: DMT family transporter [Panacagrimonas sp.]